MVNPQGERPAPDPEVALFVNEHLGEYVTAMETAITTLPDAPDIVIGIPLRNSDGVHGANVDSQGRNLIFEIMEEKFLPRFSGRRMWKHVRTEFNGQHYKDIDPPAVGFELIHLSIPSNEPPKRGNGDVMVALVH